MPNDSKAVSAPANPSTEGVGNLSSESVYAEILRRSTPEPEAKEETPEQVETTETTETVETPDVGAEATEDAEETDTPATEETAESEDKEQQPDAEETPEEDVPSKLPEKVQKALDKRIGKEVAKRKVAEEKAAEADKKAAEYRARLEQLATQQAQQTVAAPTVDDPLADINTPESLERKRQLASSALQAVEDALDDNEPDEDGMYVVGERKFNRQQLKDIRAAARRDLAAVPQRKAFLDEQQKAIAAAARDFPWMNDATSELYQLAVAEFNKKPYFHKDPWAIYHVGELLEFRQSRKSSKDAGAEKKQEQVKKPAPVPPKVSVAPAVVPAKKPAAVVKDQKAAQRRIEVTKGNMTSDEVFNLLLQSEKSKAGES